MDRSASVIEYGEGLDGLWRFSSRGLPRTSTSANKQGVGADPMRHRYTWDDLTGMAPALVLAGRPRPDRRQRGGVCVKNGRRWG